MSKSIGWGGPERRRGGSSVFAPCARGGSINFQLTLGGGGGGGGSNFITGTGGYVSDANGIAGHNECTAISRKVAD